MLNVCSYVHTYGLCICTLLWVAVDGKIIAKSNNATVTIIIYLWMYVYIKNKSLGSRPLFISISCNFPKHIKLLFEGGYA